MNLCAGLAVIIYNDGHRQLKELFQLLGMQTGSYTIGSFKKQDEQRVHLSIKRASDVEKKIRQAKRKVRKETRYCC